MNTDPPPLAIIFLTAQVQPGRNSAVGHPPPPATHPLQRGEPGAGVRVRPSRLLQQLYQEELQLRRAGGRAGAGRLGRLQRVRVAGAASRRGGGEKHLVRQRAARPLRTPIYCQPSQVRVHVIFLFTVLRIRIRDLGPFCPWIRDPRWVQKIGSGPGMNNPDHISKSLETTFWVKTLKLFDADPGLKKFGSGIRDGKNSDPG
jgi:hypothetical protein